MPKILKVKVKRNKTPEKTSYTYPPEYDPKKCQVLTYETMHVNGKDECAARGGKDEYVLVVVKDSDAPAFLKSPDITEVTKDDAIDRVGAWSGQDERAPLEPRVGADGRQKGRRKNMQTDIEETFADFEKKERE